MKNKRFYNIVFALEVLLLVPLIGMQFTDEINWKLFDFIVAGVLLFGLGLMIELVLRNIKNRNYRDIVLLAVLILFFLTWAELAVGIFGTPLSGN